MAGFDDALRRQAAEQANDRDREGRRLGKAEMAVPVVNKLLKDCADHLGRTFKPKRVKGSPKGFLISHPHGRTVLTLTPDGRIWSSLGGYLPVTANTLTSPGSVWLDGSHAIRVLADGKPYVGGGDDADVPLEDWLARIALYYRG